MIVTAADEIPCAVCGKTAASVWRTAGDGLLGGEETFTAIRCTDCGTVRLQPRPSAEEMVRHYTPATYARAEGDNADTSELGKRLALIFERQAARITEALGDKPPGGYFLDVGCGDGRFLASMATRGWRGVGIETDTCAAILARRRSGATVYETTLEDAPITPASFDLLSFLHVLEHVPDPRATLTSVYRALRPGGALLIAVPNVASVEASVFRNAWYHLDLPRHFWGFTPRSLSRLSEECGFQVRGIRYLPWLFALQSLRNVVRRAKGGTPVPPPNPAPRSESGWQTNLFRQILASSEVMGRTIPGEIMELVAVKPLVEGRR